MTKRDPSSHAAAGITVAAIADVALAVIRRSGVDGLTMRAVAERLDVRAPTLYHHVRNKSDLLDLVARNAFDQFTADSAAYEKLRTIDEWIALTRSGSLELRAFYADHPGLAGLIQSKATPNRDQGDGSRAELIRVQIDALVRLGVPGPEARQLFEVTARWSLAAVVAESAEVFTEGLDLFLYGVRARLVDLVS
ncbi:TetR/AcrR family transcriptional regulator [Kribbella jiaozuonensis]|uniref:TetR family transcriptional regulator n=1 Tax=Kribbella jiaozuonensis TaxID=2575441 RepID=A0A4U3LCJ4_9ACTN|nr:TetR/AcrR family transcriptional regulator [Kribbella jiaozuonensis]TKK72539.1 TetR family transcriptional regulator [Kribbella jiaozuonensis]